MAIKLDRRTFIRGAAGSLLALPALEAMYDSNGVARAQGPAQPKRYLATFAGTSIGGDSRTEDVVTPSTIGRDYELLDGTGPLGDPAFGNAKDRITMVSNLSIPVVGSPSADRAETQDDFHSHHLTTLFAGTGGDGSAHGTSSDQLVHAAQSDGTPLVIGRTHVDGRKANGDGGTFADWNLKSYMSFVDGRPDMAETEPGRVFDRFFPGGSGGTMPMGGGETPTGGSNDFRRRIGLSVLDLVHRRADRLSQRLGAEDRRRISDHMDAIRTLEEQLRAIPSPDPGPGPVTPPPTGSGVSCTAAVLDTYAAAMHPDVNNYYYERERGVAWASLWHLLFSCDLVRTGSHMHTFGQCFLPMNVLTGQASDLHETTHGGGGGDHALGVAWHMEQFGRLIGLLRDTPEGAGSVLDSCAITMVFEGGSASGSGFGGGSHTVQNMTALIAGGVGGLVQGEHIRAPAGYQPGNLVVTAMRAAGVDANLGALTREIPGVRA